MVLPAAAAGLTWLSPGAGAVVSGPVDIAVRIDRQLGETVDGVAVRLSLDGSSGAPGTRTAALRCAESDGCNTVGDSQDRWGLVALDADGGELATGPVCNGQYVLQAQPAGAAGWAGTPVVLSDRAVAPVTGLAADGEPRTAQLSWTPPANAGDVRLRIERRPEGSPTWDVVAVLSGATSGYTDQLDAGTYDYRVVSTRGDGFVDGRPVAACSDTDADVRAASAPVRAIVAPGPEPGPSASTSGSDDGPGTATTEDDTAAGPTEDPRGSAGQDAASGDDTVADGSDGSAAEAGSGRTTSGSRTRIAAPPPARRSSNEVRAPEIARPSGGGTTYFGEDDPFADELDYGDAAPVTAADGEPDGPMGRLVAGGTRTLTELELDRRQVLLPVAAGLLLLACGMHVRRWMGSA